MTDAARMILDLQNALAALGVETADSVKAWLERPQSVSHRPSAGAVRIAQHFDLNAPLLVLDRRLGTLGIVNVVTTGPDGDARTIDTQVREYIDAAAYARHLLLRDPGLRRAIPSTIELVLLANEDPVVIAQIGTTLREVIKTSETLFHVGIGVLIHRGGNAPFARGLRRAFPWLLTATRQWLEKSPVLGPAKLHGVRLTNYRLAGTRELTLADARLHLIHGPNGSGKSSLVEAIELLITGKIEWLEEAGEREYLPVIAHDRGKDAAATRNATVHLSREPDAWVAHTVTDSGIENALQPGLAASSFRLNQRLMDRLAGLDSSSRAATFISALFPDAAPHVTAFKQARAAVIESRNKLQPYLDRMLAAQAILLRLKDWRGQRSDVASGPPAHLLNVWLERTVLAELALHVLTVGRTLDEAKGKGWSADPRTLALLAAADVDVPQLQKERDNWLADAERIRMQLGPTQAATPSPAVAIAPLTREEADTLNQLDRWLFNPDHRESFGPFGDKVRKVMTTSAEPATYANFRIGDGDWTAHVLPTLTKMIDALGTLGSETAAAPEWPGLAPFPEYEAAETQQAAFLAAGREVSARFTSILTGESATGDQDASEFDGSLIAALNELIALFTPARWAYEDIALNPALLDGVPEVHIAVGSSRARGELRLNTAELNLFTVALFLLRARQVPNPLNVLLLDDPLQNMDELTSTALARGLAKLARIRDENDMQRILLFFHGFDDLERFREELPAAVYRLPWLTPGHTAGDAKIDIKLEPDSRNGAAVQKIEKLVEAVKAPTPPSRNRSARKPAAPAGSA